MKATAVIAAATAALAFAVPAAAQTALKTKRIVASGLQYTTCIASVPGDATRLFVLEKAGRIRIVDLTTNTLLSTPFLTVPGVVGATGLSDEMGLLGLAFDPDYASNGQFYVYYTGSGTNNLARFKVSATNPNLADSTSGVVMMTWSDPYSNHNGGWLAFGPDRCLYMSVGDGGSANDPGNRAQTLTEKLGKMHRIKPTVGGSAPYYTIPADNPFVGGATTADDTVWAYGLRNPWRCSFDRLTGDLWIGDVGQDAVEEIDYQPAGTAGGRNYGWRCTEGTSSTGLTGCTFGDPSLTPPVHTYNHGAGTSSGYCVIGGYVYRGCRIPDLQGTYFFADYVNNNIWSFRYSNGTKSAFTLRNTELGTSIEGTAVTAITCFGEDANGELYIGKNSTSGQIFKIIPASGDGTCLKPGDLNGDGHVDGADIGLLLSGWGACGIPCPGDLNGDGRIDGADIGLLLSNWG
jgi:hypothetical protein